MMERPLPAPSKGTNGKDFSCTQYYNKLVVTVQVENAPRKKRIPRDTVTPKRTMGHKRSQHRISSSIVRSKSLNENSFFALTSRHQNAAEKNVRRSKSVPILSANLSTSDNKLNVAELTNERKPAWNSNVDTEPLYASS